MENGTLLDFSQNINDITSIYQTALIPIVAYFTKLAIDNYELSGLEKKLMSNFKKFQIALSKYLFIGVAFLAIFNLILKNQNFISTKNSEVIYVVWLACFIITIAILFLLEIFINFIFSLFNIKYDYYIVNENNEDVYRVIKLSGNNHILVESEGVLEFIDNFKRRRYRKVTVNNVFLERLYTYNHLNLILGAMILISLISLVLVLFSSGITQFILYVGFMIFLFIALVIFTNSLAFARDNPSTTNITESEESAIERE